MSHLVRGDGSSILFEQFPELFPAASCGGEGRCGRCRVRVVTSGESALSAPEPAEMRLLSAAERDAGIRLACRCVLSGTATLLPTDSSDRGRSGVSAVSTPIPPGDRAAEMLAARAENPRAYGIAVDIGTTTIALALADLDTSLTLDSVTALNSQRRFGSDVLSRVRAAVSGRASELREAVRSDVRAAVLALLSRNGISPESVRLCAVAANTVMTHLLLGISCEGFAAAPFTPQSTVFPDLPFDVTFGPGILPSCTVRFAPALGAFIGGDIAAGLCALGFGGVGQAKTADGRCELLVDLGTNAEMVLAHDGVFHTASAAAGPAFEGGHISCGTGYAPGAVTAVRFEGGRFAWDLAPGGELSGICGSGLLDFVACALEAGLIHQDGSIAPVCEDSGILLDRAGRVRLLAADVREFQLAKAAIRAGLELLLSEAKVPESAVTAVHLAGGFGQYLRESSAVATGLIPASFSGRTRAAGNTSLAGALLMLRSGPTAPDFNAILTHAVPVSLADLPAFNRHFIDAMEFPA